VYGGGVFFSDEKIGCSRSCSRAIFSDEKIEMFFSISFIPVPQQIHT
jgi:hypothetical protein